MREIVDRILHEEQSARSAIEQAQERSRNIVLKAKEESASIIQEAVNKAEELVRDNKEQSERNFLADKERIIREAKESAGSSRSGREKDIPGIAREIFRKIITIKG